MFLYVAADAPNTGGTAWFGINNLGTIVGQVLDTNTGSGPLPFTRAALFPRLAISNSTWSTLYSVRDNGMSVGTYYDQNNISHGYLRGQDGTLTYMPDVVAGGSTLAAVSMTLAK